MRSKNPVAVVAAAVVLAACFIVAAPDAAAENEEPVGDLAELMRAILFPNSNFLFDVQMTDPGNPPDPAEEGDGNVSSLFSGIYTGWQVPQQAALALAEVESLIMNPDRMCQNGRPAPVGNEDYQKYARQLTEVAKKIYAAAHEEDRDTVSDLTNELAGACEDCHAIYRRYPESSRCR